MFGGIDMNGKNAEGYADPTAETAIRNVTNEKRHMPLVYICSRYAGDTKKNTADAIRFCRFAIGKGCIPLAVHLLYPQILHDENPAERDLGLYFGWVLINKCSEVWVFSDGTISPGMKKEIIRAKSKNMRIRRFDLNCVEEG